MQWELQMKQHFSDCCISNLDVKYCESSSGKWEAGEQIIWEVEYEWKLFEVGSVRVEDAVE